jgi:16S rRNA (guanine527-N7)-methyltransferase
MSDAMNGHLATMLAQGLAEMDLPLDVAQQSKLLAYVALLQKWNKTYSLTAIREPERMVTHHLLDSLAPLKFLPATPLRMVDVGSGFGTPGIPFAIARPDWQLTLLDSNHKKTTFLRQAVLELQLPNVSIITGRVEAVEPEAKFDVITSRAFANLGDFIRWTEHLLADGGEWAALKGVYPHEELAGLPASVYVDHIDALQVPGLEAERHLVHIRKQA